MAAGLARKLYGPALTVESCGLEPRGEIDPMVVAVMQEIGIDLVDHRLRDFTDVPLASFDLVIALTDEAGSAVRTAGAATATPVEVWLTEDPTAGEGSREMRLEAYRMTRRALEARIVDRFGPPAEWE
jgi:protein-tyrosine-phosphatase